MYRNSVTLGSDDAAGWKAELFTDFAHKFTYNAARDKDLWTDPKTDSLFSPKNVLTNPPNDTTQLIAAMAAESFVPVYEGKHVEQFIYGIKPFRWWLKKALAKAKHDFPHPLSFGSHVVFCIAHRARCWRAIINFFRVETVEKCCEEAAIGDKRRSDYVAVDVEEMKKAVTVHAVSLMELAEIETRLAEPDRIDMGEKHLLAHAIAKPGRMVSERLRPRCGEGGQRTAAARPIRVPGGSGEGGGYLHATQTLYGRLVAGIAN